MHNKKLLTSYFLQVPKKPRVESVDGGNTNADETLPQQHQQRPYLAVDSPSTSKKLNEIMSLRPQVIKLYKTLLFLGREYPQGFDFFRTRLKRAFVKNRDVQDAEKIKTMLKHGEYVIKELEALYMLRKYRTLKRRYYNEPVPEQVKAQIESKL